MNLPVTLAGAAAAAAAAWHVASGPFRPAYDISIDTAETRLRDMSFEEGMLTGTPFSLAVEGEGGRRAVRWAFGKPRAEASASSCTVALEAMAPERTAYELDCAVDPRNADPALIESSRKLLKLIVAEHVEASLAGRPFDHSSMGTKLIAFSIAHRAAFIEATRRAEAAGAE